MEQTAPAPMAAPKTIVQTPRWKVVLLQLVFILLLLLRVAYDLRVMPMGDEAYYWMWGQHVSWSYFDHPPLIGWVQALAAMLFGWNTLSVRLSTWLALAASLWILWLWSGRLAPDDREGWFWPSAVLFLSMPVMFLMTMTAMPDHLLIALGMGSIYCFHGFAESGERGQPRWRRLYLSAVLLGLAVLSKYNGVFIGVGFAAWILVRPKLRSLFLDWKLWGAALLAVAIQAPVFYWNATEGAASFRFHLAGRGLDLSSPQPLQSLSFIGGMIISIGPIVFGALFRLLFVNPDGAARSQARGLAITLFSVSTLFWVVVALFLVVYFHWNIVAYIALAPIVWTLIGGRIALWLHIAFGLLLSVAAIANYGLVPLPIPGIGDPVAGNDYGWLDLGAKVDALRETHPGAFLAATRYTYAAQLGLVLHDADVAAFNATPSQIDYWWDAPSHKGEDALIIADPSQPIDAARPHFDAVEKLADVPAYALGTQVWTYEIWLGRTFHG